MEKKVTITYLLNEKGRKASLLAGGDGKQEQSIYADVTPEALELARVDCHGMAKLEVGGSFDGFCCFVHADDLRVELRTWDHPHIVAEQKRDLFDAPQTPEALIAFETARRAALVTRREELKPELDAAMAEWEVAQAAEKDRKAKENEEYSRKMAEETAKREAELKAREAEKAEWIEAHGSDFLKRAHKLEYDCQRKYITERAALELPCFAVDFDDNAGWKSRSCPSEEALAEVETLCNEGWDARVVWLTAPVESDWGEEYEEQEAIVIQGYCGKYDLVREL